jgi:hypothetical protein
LSELPDDVLKILVNDPFDKPLGHWPLAKYVRGQLLGNSPTLAREGNQYTFLR